MTIDTSYSDTTTTVQQHSHTWHAWDDDRVWRCTKPDCGAWISRLVDADGREIKLPKDRHLHAREAR